MIYGNRKAKKPLLSIAAGKSGDGAVRIFFIIYFYIMTGEPNHL